MQFNKGLLIIKNMKIYTIEFMDKDYNDLMTKVVIFKNLKQVKSYAKEILANLCDNDIVTFRIY